MVNLVATPPPKGVSAKGIRYHLICFFCVQRGYIHLYNRLKLWVQSKESFFVVQAQKFHICSLPMTTYCFVGQLHKCTHILEILKQYEEALGQQINQDKTQLFFNPNTETYM